MGNAGSIVDKSPYMIRLTLETVGNGKFFYTTWASGNFQKDAFVHMAFVLSGGGINALKAVQVQTIEKEIGRGDGIDLKLDSSVCAQDAKTLQTMLADALADTDTQPRQLRDNVMMYAAARFQKTSSPVKVRLEMPKKHTRSTKSTQSEIEEEADVNLFLDDESKRVIARTIIQVLAMFSYQAYVDSELEAASDPVFYHTALQIINDLEKATKEVDLLVLPTTTTNPHAIDEDQMIEG